MTKFSKDVFKFLSGRPGRAIKIDHAAILSNSKILGLPPYTLFYVTLVVNQDDYYTTGGSTVEQALDKALKKLPSELKGARIRRIHAIENNIEGYEISLKIQRDLLEQLKKKKRSRA